MFGVGKKYWGVIILSTFVLSLFPGFSGAFGFAFNDVKNDTAYRDAIYWAYDNGIINGYGNGNFGPDNCVRRAELLKMIIEYSGGVSGKAKDAGFYDVSRQDWFYKYVNEGKFRGVIEGYSDGSFKPNICVNRAEAMKIAVGAILADQKLDYSSAPLYFDNKVVVDAESSAWYAPYARLMFTNRLVGTNHTVIAADVTDSYYPIKFFPSDSMSRKEVAQMLYLVSRFKGSNPISTPVSTLSIPGLISPSSNASLVSSSETNVDFRWDWSKDVEYYKLMVRDATSSNYFIDLDLRPYQIESNLNGYGANFRYRFSKGTNANYYWKVRAYDKNGNFKESSERYFSIRSLSTMSTPVLIFPKNGDQFFGNQDILFSWLPVEGADYYEFFVKFGGYTEFSRLESTYSTNSKITADAFPDFGSNSKYIHRWKVNAVSPDGVITSSPEFSFVISK